MKVKKEEIGEEEEEGKEERKKRKERRRMMLQWREQSHQPLHIFVHGNGSKEKENDHFQAG